MYKHGKNFVNEIPVLLENLSILDIFDNNKIFYNIDNFIRYFKENIFENKKYLLTIYFVLFIHKCFDNTNIHREIFR